MNLSKFAKLPTVDSYIIYILKNCRENPESPIQNTRALNTLPLEMWVVVGPLL